MITQINNVNAILVY